MPALIAEETTKSSTRLDAITAESALAADPADAAKDAESTTYPAIKLEATIAAEAFTADAAAAASPALTAYVTVPP